MTLYEKHGVIVYIDPYELNDGWCDIDTVKLTSQDVDKIYDIIERDVKKYKYEEKN